MNCHIHPIGILYSENMCVCLLLVIDLIVRNGTESTANNWMDGAHSNLTQQSVIMEQLLVGNARLCNQVWLVFQQPQLLVGIVRYGNVSVRCSFGLQ
jgi:hypothetical protein